MTAVIHRYPYLIGTIIFSVVILILIFGVFNIDNATNSMIVEYVTNLGWEVNPSPAEISHITIPNQFDEVYETYNSVQKASGFDLTPFRGKRVVRYTYQLKNHIHSNDSRVFLGVMVYESRIIAGDISSTDINGFMHGITEVSNIINNE